jgi:hypothetical protein
MEKTSFFSLIILIIAMLVKKGLDNKRVLLPVLIKNTNTKSIQEINQEIQSVKNQIVQDESDFVLGVKQSKFKMNLFNLCLNG